MKKAWLKAGLAVATVSLSMAAQATLLAAWDIQFSDPGYAGYFRVPNNTWLYPWSGDQRVNEIVVSTPFGPWDSFTHLHDVDAAFFDGTCVPEGCLPNKLSGTLLNPTTQHSMWFGPGWMMFFDDQGQPYGGGAYSIHRRQPDIITYTLDFGVPGWSGTFLIDLASPNFANDDEGTRLLAISITGPGDVWDVVDPDLAAMAYETSDCIEEKGECEPQKLMGGARLVGANGTTLRFSFTGSTHWHLYADASDDAALLQSGTLTLKYLMPEPGPLALSLAMLGLLAWQQRRR